jgi:hypothetical protein
MAQLVNDLIDPQVLTDFVRAYDNEVLREEANWTLDRWLPNRYIDDLDYRIRKGALNDVDIAEYRAFDTPARMTDRPGTFFIEGSLGPVSRQIPLGEEEFLRARSLQANSNDPIIQQIYEDSTRMIRAVQGRVEVARGDVINDGIVTIAENGLVLTANFGRAALMSKTAAIPWTTTATATPLADLLSWQNDYITQNGMEPAVVLTPKTRIGSLALNVEMRNYAAANGTVPTRINRATIDSILSAEGLPPFETYDGQVRKDGVATRVLPVDKVYLMPPEGNSAGNTFYGPTPEALLLAERGLIDRTAAPGVIAVITRTEHPVQTYTVGTAIALPAMPNPDLILDADVA